MEKLNDPELTSLLRKGEKTSGNDSVPIPMIQLNWQKFAQNQFKFKLTKPLFSCC